MHKVGFIIILSVTKLTRMVIMVMEYAHNTISVGFLIKYRFFGNTLSTLGEHTLRKCNAISANFKNVQRFAKI